MQTLADKILVFNQNKSVPVDKDQFKPYCNYHCKHRTVTDSHNGSNNKQQSTTTEPSL